MAGPAVVELRAPAAAARASLAEPTDGANGIGLDADQYLRDVGYSGISPHRSNTADSLACPFGKEPRAMSKTISVFNNKGRGRQVHDLLEPWRLAGS